MQRARLWGAEEGSGAFNFYDLARIELDLGRGQLAEATRRIEELERRYEGPGLRVWLTGRRAELALLAGEPLLARAAVAEAVAGIAGLGEAAVVDELVHAQAYALGLRAEADMAVIARARQSDLQTEEARAIALRLLAGIRAFHKRLERAAPAVAQRGAAWLVLYKAESARLEGRSSAPRWAAVAGAWEALGLAYLRAYALYREGQARLAEGGRTVSVVPLREAHTISLALGAEPLRRMIEALAARARMELGTPDGKAPAEAQHNPYGLTSREREVLALVAAGRTNRQIGEALFITEKTASVHVSNILGKLRVAGRTEAAAIAYKMALTDPHIELTAPERRASTS